MDDGVEQVLEEYAAAVVRAKDVHRFLALYRSDVGVFDMWGRSSYDGAEARRATATEWFDSRGNEQVAAEFSDVETVICDEVAVAHAFVTHTVWQSMEPNCAR